jgi:hypothetical protein
VRQQMHAIFESFRIAMQRPKSIGYQCTEFNGAWSAFIGFGTDQCAIRPRRPFEQQPWSLR